MLPSAAPVAAPVAAAVPAPAVALSAQLASRLPLRAALVPVQPFDLLVTEFLLSEDQFGDLLFRDDLFVLIDALAVNGLAVFLCIEIGIEENVSFLAGLAFGDSIFKGFESGGNIFESVAFALLDLIVDRPENLGLINGKIDFRGKESNLFVLEFLFPFLF